MSIELVFCDLCNESVPASDLASGRARRLGSRVVCSACEAAMGGATATAAEGPGASPAPAAPELVNAGLDSAALDDTAELPSASVPPGAVAEGPQGNSSQWVGLLALAVAALGSWLLSVRQDEAEQNGARRVQALSAQQRERARATDGALEGLRAELQAAATARQELAEALGQQREELASLLDERVSGLQAALAEQKAATDALFAELAGVGPAQQARLEELAERLDLQARESRLRADQLEDLEDSLRQLALAPVAPAGAPAGGGTPEPSPGADWQRFVGDLTDPNPGLRLDAVYALGDSKDAAVVPHLEGMLEDGDLFVRMATCRVLMELGARSAVPGLINALGDEQSAVREAAMVALRELTGRNFRFDPVSPQAERAKRQADWRAWWNREGASGR
ncbi:MAG: HEAT repeat domain-containing protein [Planctomycetota bacterium]|nr:HEAT repeat domain-containing protein [Planctomycetota bacterium]